VPRPGRSPCTTLYDRNRGQMSVTSKHVRAADGIMTGARGQLLQPNETEAQDAVLVVEDEVLVRMLIADELRTAGYAVIEASNAQEALDLLRHDIFGVSLILSDIRMPGDLDGLGLARIVRSEYPMIKIVLTSGHLMVRGEVENDGFFAKPYDAVLLINHIKMLLD
jgi:two-component system, response regulator PdtaR